MAFAQESLGHLQIGKRSYTSLACKYQEGMSHLLDKISEMCVPAHAHCVGFMLLFLIIVALKCA